MEPSHGSGGLRTFDATRSMLQRIRLFTGRPTFLWSTIQRASAR